MTRRSTQLKLCADTPRGALARFDFPEFHEVVVRLADARKRAVEAGTLERYREQLLELAALLAVSACT